MFAKKAIRKIHRVQKALLLYSSERCSPAKSPDFNICENLFNEITTRLAEKGINEGWPRNKHELLERLDEIVHSIPKSWFLKAFDSLPDRWAKCVKNFGKLTDFYCPKYT